MAHMETTRVDYLRAWEARRPEQILYRSVDVEGREFEHHTYQGGILRLSELVGRAVTSDGDVTNFEF